MDYKNLFLRSIFSLVILSLYFLTVYKFDKYFLILIIFFYFIFCLEILLYFNKLKFIYFLYILISFLFCLQLTNYNNNFIKLNFLILIIISFDIFSYLLGSYFGKNMIHSISPNKTYEGLFGGIIITNSICIFYILFYFETINYSNILFVNIIILFSFVGDLIESYFKRINYLKNSSNFLPGHGGFLDRFDSFILSIIPFILFKDYLL